MQETRPDPKNLRHEMPQTESSGRKTSREHTASIGLEKLPERLAIAVLLSGLFVYLWIALRWNINWDEFNFLAGVYAVQQGREIPGLNDFHTLLYAWLTALPGSEVDQIIVARVVQLAFFAGAMALLFLLARKFLSRSVALIVVVLCITYTDLIRHGVSFRFDTLCLFFSLLAAYLFYTGKGTLSSGLAGLALAVSTLVSVKSIFYVIPLGILGLYLIGVRPPAAKQAGRLAVLIMTTGVFFLQVFFWRSSSGAPPSPDVAGASATALESLSRAGTKMFLTEGLLPKADYLARGIAQNAGHWLLIAAGLATALAMTVSGGAKRHHAVTALILSLPLASILIYRNSFAYFYVYVLPPAMLAAGMALETARLTANRYSTRTGPLLLLAAITAPLITASQFLLLESRQGTENQRGIVSAAHRIFPEETPYIGPHGLISSFPKHGFFMSTWGMDRYHRRGEPIFEQILEDHQPKFLLRTHPALAAVSGKPLTSENLHARLLPKDQQVLRENFIHHWGPISVAGKRIELERTGEKTLFNLLVPGQYTVEAKQPVSINGQTVIPRDTIELSVGTHAASANAVAVPPGLITLRWGDNLPVPAQSPPSGPLHDGL
ncbi:MAG: glycosyltransferase family 39 protein [Spiribacter salinus]|uniref:Glycosyltransferase family 39 protein n=1 Tax=Spiribacter salinus TaxID=1335746 RepID=A0A540VLU2_9GAMM|nr:MAG: glycosyltransferase family 39 protein [Spiribacter salinus]